MNNDDLASAVLQGLQQLGVKEYLVCAGARNAPLVYLLHSAQGVVVRSFFEERSAAFFALGRAKALQGPVAVVTTSGTAVAELLPATIEAYYAGWPLILVTADRPPEFRQTGAPQSIEQPGIFSHYVEMSYDFSKTSDLEKALPALQSWSARLPLHLNVCFEEPKKNLQPTRLNLSPAAFRPARPTVPAEPHLHLNDPLILVSGLRAEERAIVLSFLKANNAPVYIESCSGLRGKISSISEGQAHELLVSRACKSVLRFGSVPTCRLWRDLEGVFCETPVTCVSSGPWKGLSRSDVKLRTFDGLQGLSLKISSQTTIPEVPSNAPTPEKRLVRSLAEKIEGRPVYLGNSLPIREWDEVTLDLSFPNIEANRGANGIDGQVSTFLGWSEGKSEEHWALIGDLTAMYDLAALAMTRQLSAGKRRIVILNNSGGKIFDKMFSHPGFLNTHSFEFSSWAKMFGWDYKVWDEIPASIDFPEENMVIEIRVPAV